MSYKGPPRKPIPGWTGTLAEQKYGGGWGVSDTDDKKERTSLSGDRKYCIESRWCESSCCRVVTLYAMPEKRLIDVELTDIPDLSADYMACYYLKHRKEGTRMKSVIAMKIRGKWQQAELTIEVAQGILKHDTAFEEIMFIEKGELKKLVRPATADASPESPPDNPASPQSTPQ